MKNLKISFALITAVLAISITAATKANFRKRAITACFTELTLQDAAGTTLALNVSPTRTCIDAKSQAITKPIVHSANVATAHHGPNGCPSNRFFCCVRVTEITDISDPLYTVAPFIDLGEGLRKYKIAIISDIYCKLTQ